MAIHRDLLPTIFAYTGLSQWGKNSAISQELQNLCASYHYITSLDLSKEKAIKLFLHSVFGNCARLVKLCLLRQDISPIYDDYYAIRLATYKDI